MSVLLSDVKLYAATVTPEDDVATGIGGAILTSKKFDFTDIAGAAQVVSDTAGDTTQTITVTYRDATNTIQTVVIALNGTTVVTNATALVSILKAVKSASTAGHVALENQTATFTGTLAALGAAADQVVFPGAASAVSGFYTGMVLRVTAGTGSGKIFEVIAYDGPSKTATLNRGVVGVLDATSVIRVATGVFFDKTPSEITYVVRFDYNSQANALGGAEIDFYYKAYFKHTDQSASGLTLTQCAVALAAGPLTRVTFALDSAIDGVGTNGANNRQVAPTGVTAFDGTTKGVPGGSLAPTHVIGVWMKLADPGGGPALRTTWTPQFQAVSP